MLSCLIAIMLAASPGIQGNTTVSEYKLVQLDAGEVGENTAVLWDVFPEEIVDIKEYTDGSLIFTGPPGSYRIKLRLITGRNVETYRATVNIVQGDNPDPKPPGPKPPGPLPDPILPDGKFKLARRCHDWATSINSTNRAAEAAALASSLDSCIAAANAGTVTTIDDFMKLCRDTNRQALGAAAPAWSPFFSSLKDALDNLYDSKLLLNLEDYKTAFSEISQGLRGVK